MYIYSDAWDEGVEGASILIWEWRGRKGGWEKVDGLGSESASSSVVSMSEVWYWELVLYIVVVELASKSMLDELLEIGDSGVESKK